MSLVTFEDINTGTTNKLALIQKQVELITSAFPNEFSGYCVGLPGDKNQCSRHVDEYLQYGIRNDKHIFVDYDPLIHLGHKEWKQENEAKTILKFGDIKGVLKSLWNKGVQIDIVDYDGTRFFNESHEWVLNNAAKHDVKVVVLVMTTRCNSFSNYYCEWRDIFGLRKRQTRRDRAPSEPVKEVSVRALRFIAEDYGFAHQIFSYVGRDCGIDRRGVPMLAGIFLNKKFMG